MVGTVKEPEKNHGDGDATFNLAPDPAYASMLNEKNRQEGGIHVEIVPADQAGCVKGQPVEHPGVTGLGTCTGAHLKLPRAGAHVRVVGAYVLDVNNNWNEFHPVWKISDPVNSRRSSSPGHGPSHNDPSPSLRSVSKPVYTVPPRTS